MEAALYILIFFLFVMNAIAFRQIKKINERLQSGESSETLSEAIDVNTAQDLAARVLDRHVSEYHKRG